MQSLSQLKHCPGKDTVPVKRSPQSKQDPAEDNAPPGHIDPVDGNALKDI